MKTILKVDKMFDFSKIDFAQIFHGLLTYVINLLMIPFNFWAGLPAWVRYLVYSLILIFAIFMGIVTWKYREILKYY